MKKQVKIILFALFTMLIAMTMIISIAAATDGATDEADGHFYEVTDKDGENAAYYTTLQAAINAVTDGGTITVLKNASETLPSGASHAITLDGSGVSYTITGGEAGKTIAINGGSGSTNMFSIDTNESVTFENLTFTTTVATWQAFIRMGSNTANANNESLITLNNVVANFNSKYTFWFPGTHDLLIKGNSSVINNYSSGNLIRTNTGAAYSNITFESGTFKGMLRLQTSETFTMTGGTLDGYFYTVKHTNFRYFDTSDASNAVSALSSVTNFKSGGYINIGGTAVINAGSKNVFDLTQPATITVSGNAKLSTTAAILGLNDGSYYLNGSTVVGWTDLTVTGGTFTAAQIAGGVSGAVANINISGGSFTISGVALPGVDSVKTELGAATIHLSGDAAQLISTSASAANTTVNGTTITLSKGAVAPYSTSYKAFTATASVTDTATFYLYQAGEVSIATKADLVTAIKANEGYAYLTIPEAWHPTILNNDGLSVTLDGDAKTEQTASLFMSAVKGTFGGATASDNTTYVEGTHFYKITLEDKNYYYATLMEAASAVADGGTITLLANAKETAPSLGVAKTYVIDGAGFTVTITPAQRSLSANDYTTTFHIYAGNVTLKNITFALAEGATKPSTYIYVQNEAGGVGNVKLTLEDFVSKYDSSFGMWITMEATVTIKGSKTYIVGGSDGELMRIQSGAKASVITFEGGTFEIPYTGIRARSNGATINLNGGSFIVTKYLFSLNDDSAKNNTINITGGTYTTTESTGEGYFVYSYTGSANTYNISGGTFTHKGVSGFVFFRTASNSNKFNFPANGTAVINAGVAKYIFQFNSGSSDCTGSSLLAQSGTFDGASCWMFANRSCSISIGGTAHFKDTNNTLNPGAIITPSRYIGGFSLNGANGDVIVNIAGGTIETNPEANLASAIYGETITLNISGGTIKGSNNVIRIGNGASTINVSGGSLVNIGSANQLIRVNTATAVCTINIKAGANLVQEQNQAVIRVQSGVGLINMTGGTVTAKGGATPFLISLDENATTTDSAINISGGTIVANMTVIHADAGKEINISGGIFVLNDTAYTLVAASDETATPVSIAVSNATVLLASSTELSFGNGEIKSLGSDAPSARFGGKVYRLYMQTATNAEADIVTEATFGASILLSDSNTTSGIRFVTTLSDSIVALAKAALDSGKKVSYGTLIAPADYVAAVGSFTKEALSKLIAPAGKVSFVDVPAVNSLRDWNDDGVYESFSAALINITTENYSREFAAVAYVVIDGTTYYSAYNTIDNARSIKQIAVDLLKAGTYEGDTDTLALLEAYAAGTDSDKPGFHPSYTPNEIEVLDPSREYTVLFIGNSYTIVNDLAGTVFPMVAASAGYRMNTVKAIKSSWYLLYSANPEDENGAKVHAALNDHDVDFVIMQEQSTSAILNPAKFYDGARAINELAIKEGATPILYGTWGRKAGHSFLASNNLTTETMMWKIAAAYAAIGEELGIDVSNVGMAFYDVYANNPTIELYDEDKHHPSYAGTFLAAMTIFARMTGVDPTTIPYNGDGTITADVAAILKEAARKAVFETPNIPDEYKTTSEGVTLPDSSIDFTGMDNLTTLPSSSIISANITGTKGQVSSSATSKEGLTDQQKADIADIGYGISFIGVEKMNDTHTVGSLIDGCWSSSEASNTTFDSNKYNIKGEVDENGLYVALITLNFGSTRTFDAIGFCSGGMEGFAGSAEVFVSDDGVNWTCVTSACWDKVNGAIVSATTDKPTDANGYSGGVTCLFNMKGVTGQYIRMGVVIGRHDDPANYNSLNTRELVVYGK